jgi:hypothetical protein
MLSQSDHLYFARFPNPLVTKAWPQDGKTRVTTFALYFRELAWAAPDSFLGIPDQRARGSARRWFKPGPISRLIHRSKVNPSDFAALVSTDLEGNLSCWVKVSTPEVH